MSACLRSLVRERDDAGQLLALQELKGGATAGAAVRDLVLSVILLAGRGRVATANDGDGARAGGGHNRIHEGFGANLEFRHLEDAHGAVPDNGLGLINSLFVRRHGLLTAVKAHETIGDTLLLCGSLDLTVLAKLGGDGEVHRQDDLNSQVLRLLHDVGNDLRALLVIEGRADGHVVADLQEGVGHAAANDHLVDLVQHVHDELDLVADLGTTQDGEDGLRRGFQDLRKGVELLGHQTAGALYVKTLANHGAVRAVGGAKGVVAVDVRELADGRAELGDLVLVRLHLVALRVHALALLLDMKAQVLQQEDRAGRRIRAGRLDLSAAAVRQEGHRLPKLLLHDLGHRRQRVLVHLATVWPAQVRGENHGLGAALQDALDGGQRAVDALRVGDDGWVLLVLGHVEVHTHEDTLAGNVNILDLELGRHG
mmetsp:Transcript_24291/g.76681  ORF Transcript_24291/g.76681 Transcript_24291/m.76681 type:complete len:426 (-) Transcript_24291:71-1348(-)